MNSVLLILNGEIDCPKLVKSAARRVDMTVCTDGGLKKARELGLRPDIVIGDMDSLPQGRPALPPASYVCDFSVDRSDLEKALDFLRRRATPRRLVLVAGALGGRLDHQLVNLALLERFCGFFDIRLIGRDEARLLGPGKHAFRRSRGSLVTLLPATQSASISAQGLLYPLRKTLLPRSSRGLSNKIIREHLSLTIHRGSAWIIFPAAA